MAGADMLVLPLAAAWPLLRLALDDAAQFVRVRYQVDGLHDAVGHVEDDARDRGALIGDHDAGPAVHLRDARAKQIGERFGCDGLQELDHPLLGGNGQQEPGDLVRPLDGTPSREDSPAAVANERHTRRQDLHESVQVPVDGSLEEMLGHLLTRGLIGVEPRGALPDVIAGPASQLPASRLAAPEDLGDLGVGHRERPRNTNTALSSGDRVSSTMSIAIETDSAISASSATSRPVRSGSGSQGPT